MSQQIPHKAACEAERKWLCRYGWGIAVLGVVVGLVIGAGLWGGVLLDRRWLPNDWSGWVTRKGLALGLGLALIPVVWRLCLSLETRCGAALRAIPVAPFLAALVVIGAETAFRMPRGQELFWQSVIARAGEQSQAREVGLFRLDAASSEARSAGAPSGFVVSGTSQLVHGLDLAALSRACERPTYRRAVAGLFPVEMVASQGFLDFNTNNTLVTMLSGFDLGARADLLASSARPQATLRGVRNVFSASEPMFRIRHWRSFVDLFAAATCDLWRSRDYVRFLLENPFSVYKSARPSGEAAELAAQQDAYRNLGEREPMVELCLSALDRFFSDLSGQLHEIVVFEGQVNPAYPAQEQLAQLSTRMHAFLLKQQELGRITYVTRAQQGLDIPASDWRDMTHVTSDGRTLLTEMFVRHLCDAP